MVGKRKAIMTRLPEDLAGRLRAAADLDRRSVNSAIEIAIVAYLADVERRLGSGPAIYRTTSSSGDKSAGRSGVRRAAEEGAPSYRRVASPRERYQAGD